MYIATRCTDVLLINTWMGGWMDGWMDGRMDGWKSETVCYDCLSLKTVHTLFKIT